MPTLTYRSVELPLFSKNVWVGGRRMSAQDFAKHLLDIYFFSKQRQDEKSKIWLYDTTFNVQSFSYTMLGEDKFTAVWFLTSESNQVARIEVAFSVKKKPDAKANARDEALRKGLEQVMKATGGKIIHTQISGSQNEGGNYVYELDGLVYFMTETKTSFKTKDYVIFDLMTKDASEKLRATYRLNKPPFRYTPKDVVTRYDVPKKFAIAKQHLARIGADERKEAKRLADIKARQKAYEDWWNSLTPKQQQDEIDRSRAEWEQKNRPYRND